MRFFKAAAIAAVVVAGASISRGAVIVTTATFGGATYESFTADGGGGIDFNDAEAFAVSQGGHLVSVHSALENAFIYDTFAAPENAFIWTGLNDLGNVPNFTYTDGSPVDFTSYAAGEPNGDGGPAGGAVHFWSPGFGNDYTWNDVGAGVTNFGGHDWHGVLKIVPEPASLGLLAIAGLGVLARRRV